MCMYVYIPTCKVFLAKLDQGEDHAVSHLVGELRVERVQLDDTETQNRLHKNIKHCRRTQTEDVSQPNILRDFSSF